MVRLPEILSAGMTRLGTLDIAAVVMPQMRTPGRSGRKRPGVTALATVIRN